MKFLAGSLVFLVGLIWMMAISGGSFGAILYFLDAPTLISLAFAVLFTIITSRNSKMFTGGIKAAFDKRAQMPAEDKEKAIGFFKVLRRNVLLGGLVFFVANAIILLPDIAHIIDSGTLGVMLSINMLNIYYAMLFVLLFCNPIISNLENNLIPAER